MLLHSLIERFQVLVAKDARCRLLGDQKRGAIFLRRVLELGCRTSPLDHRRALISDFLTQRHQLSHQRPQRPHRLLCLHGLQARLVLRLAQLALHGAELRVQPAILEV